MNNSKKHNTSSESALISSVEAAEATGLTRDYVAKLCRMGVLRCRHDGPSWLIEKASLAAFVVERERRQRVLAQQLVEERKREHLRHRRRRTLYTLAAACITLITLIPLATATNVFQDARYAAQFAAAAEDSSTLRNAAEEFARSFTRTVDAYFSALRSPDAERRSAVIVTVSPPPPQTKETSPTSSVARVTPTPARIATNPAVVDPPSQPIAPRLIERIVETQRIVSSAGELTEAILNERLNALDAKLSSQIYAAASVGNANSTAIVNHYNAVAGALRIDKLDDITLEDSTITGASISGASVSAASLGVTGTGTSTFAGGIQATALNITSSASTTFANGLVVADGCIEVNGTCLGTGSSITLAGSDSEIQFNNNGALGASSAFTFSSSTSLLKVTNASSTALSLFDRLYVGGTATTTIRGDAVASSIPFASSTALTVSGTGYFGTASTTNLTVSAIQSSLLFAGASGSVSGSTTLSVPFGGTGSTTLTGLLKGGGTGGIISAVPGTDYVANTTGDWTGTLDGLEGSFYLANSFSTTSTSYFLSQNQGAAFSTTSADYWLIASTSIPKTTLAINWNALQTFQSGLISQASPAFTCLANFTAVASTTAFTNSGNTYLSSLSSAVLGVDTAGKVVATTSIGANLLSGTIANSQLANSSVTINSAGLLSGGGEVLLGGTLTLNASTSPTVGYLVSTSTRASELPYASSTALTVSGTGFFATATTTTFYGANLKDCISNNVLTWSAGSFGCESDDTGAGTAWPFTPSTYNGTAVQATSTGLWLTATSPFSLIASSTFVTQASTTQLTNTGTTWLTALTSALLGTDNTGKVVATTSIGANLLSGTIENSQLANSSVTINSAGLLSGGGSVSLGGTLTLNASTSPTVGHVLATSTIASTLPYASSTALTVSGNAYLPGSGIWNSSGSVGIGTTTPSQKLNVVGSQEVAIFGSATDGRYITIGDGNANNGGFVQYQSGTIRLGEHGNAAALYIDGTNVGIGTTSPATKLDVNGNVTINGSSVTEALNVGGDIKVGTGTTGCIRDNDGTIIAGTCGSDEALKKNIAPLSGILEDLTKLQPVAFEWRDGEEFDWLHGQPGTNYGLIAQDVEKVFPDMVHVDDRGYKRVAYDVALTMRLLQGIRELNLNLEAIATTTRSSTPQSQSFASSFFSNLFARITAWLADATNGITDFFARVGNFGRVNTDELCVDDICVTREQFAAVFGAPLSTNNVPSPAAAANDNVGTNAPQESSSSMPADQATSSPGTASLPPADDTNSPSDLSPTPTPAMTDDAELTAAPAAPANNASTDELQTASTDPANDNAPPTGTTTLSDTSAPPADGAPDPIGEPAAADAAPDAELAPGEAIPLDEAA